ncbi:Hypothetical predicted protein [Paramuricea clavata]|uniref:Uncharacterized protein n=1 Tax=Paramuricea clavata TaxID=317549 RepID=A0A7D9KXJ4_PARCT|nr:Hypothetical predicted protein [Paramuricea clavata]
MSCALRDWLWKIWLDWGLVVEILAGTPFMEANDISVRPARCTVLICDTSYTYGSNETKSPAVRCAVVLRAPSTSTTIWPGEFIEIAVPDGIPDNVYALEPRTAAPSAQFAKVSQCCWHETHSKPLRPAISFEAQWALLSTKLCF